MYPLPYQILNKNKCEKQIFKSNIDVKLSSNKIYKTVLMPIVTIPVHGIMLLHFQLLTDLTDLLLLY
jgi:hypothetical protein